MSSINDTNYNKDLTVRVFDQFYNYDTSVPADEYDLVHSFFLANTQSRVSAGNLTVSLFRVAHETKIPVMTLLQGFQGQGGLNLTANLAYYLNLVRDRAALIGVGVPVQANFYAARNILQ
jgi:hypothetical protein